MKKKIIFILALFVVFTGFNGKNRIVEQGNVNFHERIALEDHAPEIVTKLKDAQVPEGHYVTFSAEFTPSGCDILWINNAGMPMKQGDRVLISLKGNTAKLTIKNLVPSDGGDYKVKISNKHGEVSSTARLFVILPE